MEITWTEDDGYNDKTHVTEVRNATLEDLHAVVNADPFACTMLYNENTGGHCLLGCVGVAYDLDAEQMHYDLLNELPLVKTLASEIRSRYADESLSEDDVVAVYTFNDSIAPADNARSDERPGQAKAAAISLIEDMLKVATVA